MKRGKCVEISARVLLKKNILEYAKVSDYIKKQVHH